MDRALQHHYARFYLDLWRIPLSRTLIGIVLAFVLFGVFLAITGRNPIEAYVRVYQGTLGSVVGLSEVGVRMIPIILTGLAATIPARVGLINVGGEGQLYFGAWAATGVALFSGIDHIWLLLPMMALAGFGGGAVWGGLAILLRSWRGVNEVISTLLLNFVAILFVDIFVFGPWKNSQGFGYPYTPDFIDAAILPAIGGTRLHLGIILPVVAVAAVYIVLNRTRWGYSMRAIGGNDEAARRRGIPVGRYLILGMLIGAGVAGLAGMAEVSGIQHHLRPGISNNFGLLGFLASWLAGHHPLTLVGTSFLLSVIIVGGDLLQIGANLPAAATLILIGLVLFLVLGTRQTERASS